ncbi:MAG: pitrilysin family protein [Patescibacteria group bacterium]|jgi:predicted Zn-dependent peptidase
MFTAHKLKNGARVVQAPFGGTEAATIIVLFKVGSRDEDLKVWGGSHFIEHLMFKGTKRRPETVDISRELDQYGAEFNAYTGKDLTAYYVKIEASKLPVAVDLLHDMLFHSVYDAKEMTKEKKVITEEIKMYEENPIMHLEDLLEEAMFDGHTLGRNIAGTAKSILDMKRDHVIAYRDRFYVPENMVIVVSGKVPDNMMTELEKTFGKVKPGTRPVFEDMYLPRTQKGTSVRRQMKPLEQIQVALGFPVPGRGHDDSYAYRLLGSILGGTMSSRLFIEVREKRGLCYTVRASVDQYDDVGVFSIRAGLDAKRLPLAAKTILAELKKIAKDGATPKELKTAKENWRGAMTLRLEDSSDRAEFYGRQELFEGKVETLDERLKRVDAVTVAQVKRVAKEVLDLSKMSLAAIGPYKTDAELMKAFGIR